MEFLFLSPSEHSLVLKCKEFLQKRYDVTINVSESVSPCEKDLVMATIIGGPIEPIKTYIQKHIGQEQRLSRHNRGGVSDASFPVRMAAVQRGNKKRKKRQPVEEDLNEPIDLPSTSVEHSDARYSDEDPVPKRPKEELPPPVDFIPLNDGKENTVTYSGTDDNANSETKVEPTIPAANFNTNNGKDQWIASWINEQSSAQNAVDETIILSDSPPPADIIPLSSGKKNEKTAAGLDDSDIIIVEDEIPRPLKNVPKTLRPVVIDGSNVAREHGKISKTFSCKGIKIAIDHFLQRGHSQVTAFVPHYRRHNKFGPVLTTDQPLLEELSQNQLVVFTPSRRIDNKRVTCYDDRFIVELATKTGGVILSNDNYRDIAAESEEFKKTINERLLMFCFVGDIIMIPQDPLGRDGPSLDNFLAFPS